MNLKAYVEGYGCSFNLNETEKIKGFLKEQHFSLEKKPETSNVIIVHSCAVKKTTENRMLNRLRKLSIISMKNNSKLIVSGCLPEINRQALKGIPGLLIAGPSLSSISKLLGLPTKEFTPFSREVKFNKLVSIFPIEQGCLSNCGFCAVSKARGKLKSFSIKELKNAFSEKLIESKEFWITGQDIGCYGKDINSSLPALLKELLKEKQNFRLRLGMMNPQWFSLMKKELLNLMKKDERIYKFLHLPVQSGSNKILKLMRRPYTTEKFIDLIEFARKKIPEITIATDIIAGYPGENDVDFKKTIDLLETLNFDVVNISRFGERPGIYANTLPEKVHPRISKERTRILTALCHKISLKRNKSFEGSTQLILVTEKGKKKSFIGRTNNYKPVVVRKNVLGRFVKVKITKAYPTYLKGALST